MASFLGTPPKFNAWNLKMMVFQVRNVLFPGAVFQVNQPLNFRGCNIYRYVYQPLSFILTQPNQQLKSLEMTYSSNFRVFFVHPVPPCDAK